MCATTDAIMDGVIITMYCFLSISFTPFENKSMPHPNVHSTFRD